jgi:hypothetical protein
MGSRSKGSTGHTATHVAPRREVRSDRSGATAYQRRPNPVDARGGLCGYLLVMGCYGHSRLRELVLGGSSEHVLGHMTIPVLMSHWPPRRTVRSQLGGKRALSAWRVPAGSLRESEATGARGALDLER